MSKDVTLYQRKPYTVCYIKDLDTDTEAFGVAKWNPNDKRVPGQGWEPVRGLRIAITNAWKEMLDIKLLAACSGEKKHLGTDLRVYSKDIDRIIEEVGIGATAVVGQPEEDELLLDPELPQAVKDAIDQFFNEQEEPEPEDDPFRAGLEDLLRTLEKADQSINYARLMGATSEETDRMAKQQFKVLAEKMLKLAE